MDTSRNKYNKEADRKNSYIFIFDADNTLWDTNATFTNAQLGMLESLKDKGFEIEPRAELPRLREFDSALVKHLGRHEYDFSALALSLYFHYSGLRVNEAIDKSVNSLKRQQNSFETRFAVQCGEAFKESLMRVPPLFLGTKETLLRLKTIHKSILILFTEGEIGRIEKILNANSLKGIFNYILNGKKSVEQFKKARSIGLELLRKDSRREQNPIVIVVGDLLDRDIRFANMIGAIAVHKPGGYKPNQEPKDSHEIPDYKINRISDVEGIIWTIERKENLSSTKSTNNLD